jgi:hypothetical protein
MLPSTKNILFQLKTEQAANVGKEVETLTNNKKELEKKLRNRTVTLFYRHFELVSNIPPPFSTHKENAILNRHRKNIPG